MIVCVRRTACAQRFISPATSSGHLHEQRIAMERQLQVPLVVERHRRRPGRARLRRRTSSRRRQTAGRTRRCGCFARRGASRLGGRPGALDPLALKICGNRAADELAVARILHPNLCAADQASRVEKPTAAVLCLERSRRRPSAPGHHRAPIVVESRQGFERTKPPQACRCPARSPDVSAEFQLAHSASLYPMAPRFVHIRATGRSHAAVSSQ